MLISVLNSVNWKYMINWTPNTKTQYNNVHTFVRFSWSTVKWSHFICQIWISKFQFGTMFYDFIWWTVKPELPSDSPHSKNAMATSWETCEMAYILIWLAHFFFFLFWTKNVEQRSMDNQKYHCTGDGLTCRREMIKKKEDSDRERE